MMRRNPIEKVEIVEPPLGELSRKGHTWRRSCFVGIFSIILFVAGVFGTIRLYVGSGPEILKSVPVSFPGDIPFYAKDNVTRITYLTDHYKSRALAIGAFVPKLVLSPLFYNLNDETSGENSNWRTAQNFWEFLTTPIPVGRDTIRIEWSKLDAEPQFIANYYINELKKSGYAINDEINSATIRQLSFTKGALEGALYIHADSVKQSGSDYAVLTVTVAPTP